MRFWKKTQITYAQKTDVYKVVKELGTEAVPVLVSMNLNPSLLGVRDGDSYNGNLTESS